MPLYEFQCSSCDCTFDRIMTIVEVEASPPPCPHCGSENVKRLLSSGSIKIGLGGYAGKIR